MFSFAISTLLDGAICISVPHFPQFMLTVNVFHSLALKVEFRLLENIFYLPSDCRLCYCRFYSLRLTIARN